MRTTVAIDDDLLADLREQAQKEGTSLAKLINRVLRHGVREANLVNKRPHPFCQKTYPMGEPKVNLYKALAIAVSLEDEEIREKLARRK